MYSITLKYLKEIEDNSVYPNDEGVTYIISQKTKNILERFEIELREYLERKYLNTKNQEIHY